LLLSSVVPRHRLSTYGRRAFVIAGPSRPSPGTVRRTLSATRTPLKLLSGACVWPFFCWRGNIRYWQWCRLHGARGALAPHFYKWLGTGGTVN